MSGETRNSLDYHRLNVVQFFDALPDAVRDDAKIALEEMITAFNDERDRAISAVDRYLRNYRRIADLPHKDT